jgi:hypothetical protein
MDSADELKEIQGITSSISKMMDSISEKSDKRNRALKQEADTMKSIASQISNVEDITKGIESLERRRNQIQKSNFGVNQKLKGDLLKMNQIAIDSLNTERRKVQVLQKVAEAAAEVGESMKDSINTLKSEIEQIPLLGGVFSKLIPTDKINASIDGMTKGFTRGFGTMFKRNLSQGKGFVKSFSGGMTAGFGQIGKSLGPLLANPYALAAAAALAFIAVGVLAFYKVTKAAQEFREETGLLNSQTKGLETQINNVYMGTSRLGASMSDVAKAAADFTNEFDGIEMASDEVLTSMIVLNKNFGIGTQEAAQLNKTFQTMGGLTAAQAQSLVNTTAEMAKMAGVAPNKVIKDMADNAEAAYRYFDGNPEALAKAAVQAAKLGTSITQAASVADGLLDFESSITNELEASAMLGTRINLSQARSLAANNDILGAQQAVLDQVSQLGDLTKLNRYEQEALAKAANMPIGDLIRQQQIRERFGRLNDEELAAAMSLLDTGKDITQINEADLAAQNEKLKKQQEMQNQFDVMKNEASAIFDELMQALMPVGKAVIAILIPIFSIIKGLFIPIGAAINNVMTAVGKLFAPFKEIFGEGSGEGLKTVLETIGSLLTGPLMFGTNLIAGIIDSIADVFGGIVKVVKGFLSGDIKMIGEGIYSIFEGVISWFLRIPIAIYDTIVGIFPSIGEFFSSLASKIQAFFMGMLPSWAQNLLGGGSSDAAQVQSEKQNEEQSQLEVAGSIDDGIVQNGKIITTNPEDTLVATKTPGDLLSSLLQNSPLGMLGSALGGLAGGIGGGAVDNTAMVSKLDELILAVKESRDVYMDGRKVTSGVSSTVDKIGSNSYAVV